MAVKKSSIDVDQLSSLSLVDFLALMIEEEASTDKLYQLMSMHASFVVQEETIKVFILKKKFQLMLRMFLVRDRDFISHIFVQ